MEDFSPDHPAGGALAHLLGSITEQLGFSVQKGCLYRRTFFIEVFGKCSLSIFVYSTPCCYKINRPMVGEFDTTFDFTVKSRRMVEESGN